MRHRKSLRQPGLAEEAKELGRDGGMRNVILDLVVLLVILGLCTNQNGVKKVNIGVTPPVALMHNMRDSRLIIERLFLLCALDSIVPTVFNPSPFFPFFMLVSCPTQLNEVSIA